MHLWVAIQNLCKQQTEPPNQPLLRKRNDPKRTEWTKTNQNEPKPPCFAAKAAVDSAEMVHPGMDPGMDPGALVWSCPTYHGNTLQHLTGTRHADTVHPVISGIRSTRSTCNLQLRCPRNCWFIGIPFILSQTIRGYQRNPGRIWNILKPHQVDSSGTYRPGRSSKQRWIKRRTLAWSLRPQDLGIFIEQIQVLFLLKQFLATLGLSNISWLSGLSVMIEQMLNHYLVRKKNIENQQQNSLQPVDPVETNLENSNTQLDPWPHQLSGSALYWDIDIDSIDIYRSFQHIPTTSDPLTSLRPRLQIVSPKTCSHVAHLGSQRIVIQLIIRPRIVIGIIVGLPQEITNLDAFGKRKQTRAPNL